VTAAELAAALADLPADTLVGFLDPGTGVARHVIPDVMADQYGVALLAPGRAITEEDVS
jgi:hypothetical protein